jgi:hypothetical protein
MTEEEALAQFPHALYYRAWVTRRLGLSMAPYPTTMQRVEDFLRWDMGLPSGFPCDEVKNDRSH